MQIAARQSFLTGRAGPSTPTARDYVQDGLVAMWDGIENAGWGQHDSSATVWRDLFGNNDMTLTGVTAWDSNSLAMSANSACALLSSAMSGYMTQELVVSIGKTGALMALFFGGAGWYGSDSRGMAVRGNGTINFIGRGKYISAIAIGTAHTISAIFGSDTSGDVSDVYIDASYESASGSGMYGLGSGPGHGVGSMAALYPATGSKYFCVRLYSRALTVAEVAANYAIDASRFNL